MAYYFSEPSRTFGEYLLVPGYSSSECVPTAVSLKTPLVKYRKGEEACPLEMNIPMVSAIMQSVSGEKLAIALAKQGGVSFIYGSQTIEQEADMVRRVKAYKKGFVTSDSNLPPEATLGDVLDLKTRTGHSTVAITDDGTAHGKLLGIVASRDYRLSRMTMDLKVTEFMTPLDKLVTAPATTSLHDCNDIIWDNKINSLPLVDEEGHLQYMVFRKDYDSHKENVNELLDENKSYIVGAGINTRDFAERVPALVEAGVDVLCIDSSEGFSEWQSRTIAWIRENYGDKVKVGAGNVVDREGFLFLAKAGADFIKTRHRAAAPSASPRDEGHRTRVRLRRSLRSQGPRRVLQGDRRLHPHLLRRRHRAGLSHHAGAGYGCGLRYAGPLLRPLRRVPDEQAARRRQLRQGVLGRGLQPRPQLAALRPGRRPEAEL